MFAHAVPTPKAKTGPPATLARASTPLLTRKPQDLAGSMPADSQPVPGSAGQPLAADVQSYFAAGFGHDFSRVRIHADAPGAATARAMGANAYTVGAHIAFAPGLYHPTSPAGMRLLAHELAHVVQQRGGGGPPGAVQEQDADAASRALVAGQEPKVRAPSQVGIAAQSEPSTVAKVKRAPFEQVTWFYHFYTDRLGYEYKDMGGNKGRLINPKGGHFVDVTLDPQSPRMVSVIVAGKSFEVSEYDFASERFETRARHIEMVEYERELSIPERIGTGITVTTKVVGGAALCVWGTAETVGFGAVAACGYGADIAASALGDLRGEDSRTLSNRAVTAGLSEIVGDETAQQLTDNAEAAVNIMLGAYGAAKPPKAPVAVAGSRPSVPEVVAPEGSTGVPAVIKPGPAPASTTPTVEIRTPTTRPEIETPAASTTPRAVAGEGPGGKGPKAQPAIDTTLDALGVEKGERGQLSTGAKVWGQVARGRAKLLTYLKFQGKKLTAGVLSSELPKIAGKTVQQVAAEERSNVIKAYLSFRQQAMTLAKQLGADTVRFEADVVINPDLPDSLVKSGFKPIPDSPGSYFKEEPVK